MQEPGSVGAARPNPANGAAAIPLWLSKHLNRANLPVTCIGSVASFSRGVHNRSARNVNWL